MPKPIGVPMESRRRGGGGVPFIPRETLLVTCSQSTLQGLLHRSLVPRDQPQPAILPSSCTAWFSFVSLVASTAVSGATCHRALLTDCGRLVTTLTLGCSTQAPRPHHTVLQGPRGADPKKQGPSQLGTQGPGAPGVGVVGGWMPFRVCP